VANDSFRLSNSLVSASEIAIPAAKDSPNDDKEVMAPKDSAFALVCIMFNMMHSAAANAVVRHAKFSACG